MATKWIELVTGSLDDKRRWRAYKARVAQLPAPYRTAVAGIERYLMYTGGQDGGAQLMAMFDDLGDLFERAALDGTPVREIVGEDPVAFVEEFKANYGLGKWLSTEQRRLTDSIAKAEAETGGVGS